MIKLFKIGTHSFRNMEELQKFQDEAKKLGLKTMGEFINFLDNKR